MLTILSRLHFRPSLSWRTLIVSCAQLGTKNMAVSEGTTMRIDSPVFHSIFTAELNELIRLFKKHSYDIRIAGGAVRDILMDQKPNDIDFATPATPTQMKDMFSMENVRMIHHKGETHGTVTVRILDSLNFEVTTLRIDKVTDGRHAEVEFTTDWQEDALRRDLTINAMFLGLDGTVYDFFKGAEDLKERRVRFVGNAEDRIREDYLRILRYFRFYGRIAKERNCHDENVLATIKANAAGLARISGERIWMELQKIIVGRFAPDLMEVMASCGVTEQCGLPSHLDASRLRSAFTNAQGTLALHPAACLGTLLRTEEEVTAAFGRLRSSKVDADMMTLVAKDWEKLVAIGNDLKAYQRMLLLDPGRYKNYRLCLSEAMKVLCVSEDTRLQFDNWTPPRFPVRGNVLSREWGIRGREVGRCMEILRRRWVESDMTATEEELTSSRMRNELMSSTPE